MSQNMIYVSIDFDDASYHRFALNQRTGEALDFKLSPDIESLYVRQLAAVNLGKRGQTLSCFRTQIAIRKTNIPSNDLARGFLIW